MKNENHGKLKEAQEKFRKLRQQAPRIAGTVAVAFFKEGMRRQGQQLNGTFKPWKKRKFELNSRKGAAVLKKTGALQRDLRFRTAGKKVAVVSSLPYSKIHNEGGQIPITSKMRRFFWAKYMEAYSKVTFSVKTKQMTKPGTLHNNDAEIWKALALTKKKHLDVPPRPFLYHTTDLYKQLDAVFIQRVKELFQ
jgi:phage gpG-like protein